MLVFTKLRYRNFLSTGDQPTEIVLNQSPTTLVVGENGAGKSTMLDALTFGLFGKAYRDINKPQLVNSINQRDCVVEVEFTVGKTQYLVRRGQKPNFLEVYVDGKMLDQDAKIKDHQAHLEENILKLNYKSFVQVVVLGIATFVPFMQLSAADRRFIIEDLLDIQIFSQMNSVLKNKQGELRTELDQVEMKSEIAREKISLTEGYIAQAQQDNERMVEDARNRMTDANAQRMLLQAENADFSKKVNEILKRIADHKLVSAKIKKLEALEDQLNTRLRKLAKEAKFFQDTTQCPECKQDINEAFKAQTIQAKTDAQQKVNEGLSQLSVELASVRKRMEEINAAQREIDDYQTRIRTNQSSIAAQDKFIAKIQSDIDDLLKRGKRAVTDTTDLDGFRKDLADLQQRRAELVEQRRYYEVLAVMLKDSGIKTKIINQYLPVINRTVNKHLGELEFASQFTLDGSFNESIRSNRNGDDLTYSSFSEGEKLRINLALLFSWREVARMKNSANVNLLVLDEVMDASLDQDGIDCFLKLLDARRNKENIIIISHRSDSLMDKFSSVIRFKKEHGFSVVVDENIS